MQLTGARGSYNLASGPVSAIPHKSPLRWHHKKSYYPKKCYLSTTLHWSPRSTLSQSILLSDTVVDSKRCRTGLSCVCRRAAAGVSGSLFSRKGIPFNCDEVAIGMAHFGITGFWLLPQPCLVLFRLNIATYLENRYASHVTDGGESAVLRNVGQGSIGASVLARTCAN